MTDEDDERTGDCETCGDLTNMETTEYQLPAHNGVDAYPQPMRLCTTCAYLLAGTLQNWGDESRANAKESGATVPADPNQLTMPAVDGEHEGRVIRCARLALDISLRWLAEGAGVHVVVLGEYERGRSLPDPESRQRVAWYLLGRLADRWSPNKTLCARERELDALDALDSKVAGAPAVMESRIRRRLNEVSAQVCPPEERIAGSASLVLAIVMTEELLALGGRMSVRGHFHRTEHQNHVGPSVEPADDM